MDYKMIIEKQRQLLYAECSDAREKLRLAVRETRARRQHLHETMAQLAALRRVLEAFSRSEEEEAAAVDNETGARVSSMIAHLLSAQPDGLTLAQLGELLTPMKKSTISATLYNMKKRNEVEQMEATGRYRLTPHTRILTHRVAPR